MRKIFTPEDFDIFINGESISYTANYRLSQILESWPEVYGIPGNEYWGRSLSINPKSTHKARLAFIEETEKKQCEHEPEISLEKEGIKVSWPVPLSRDIIEQIFFKIKCKHCGAELAPEWKEKK